MDAEERTNVENQQICLCNNVLIIITYYYMRYFRVFILYISFQMLHSRLFFLL